MVPCGERKSHTFWDGNNFDFPPLSSICFVWLSFPLVFVHSLLVALCLLIPSGLNGCFSPQVAPKGAGSGGAGAPHVAICIAEWKGQPARCQAQKFW